MLLSSLSPWDGRISMNSNDGSKYCRLQFSESEYSLFMIMQYQQSYVDSDGYKVLAMRVQIKYIWQFQIHPNKNEISMI